MNTKILMVAVCAIAFCSCSTTNKTGQTVDDVYYSAGRDGFVAVTPVATSPVTSYDNNVMLMNIRDPRWRNFDNDYAYTPYGFGYNTDYYYNPYYCTYPVYNVTSFIPVNPVNTTPRMTNLSAYKTNSSNINKAIKLGKMNAAKQQQSYNNNNQQTGTGVGNLLRQVLGTSNNTGNNSSYNNNNQPYINTNNNSNTNKSVERTYTPASSGSSNSGSSGGGSRPARSGRN